jgi:Flp pilus assembly protein TadG
MFVRSKPHPRRGATLVEFAVVSIIVFLMLFGIFEFCFIVYTYQVVENAAREGARYGVVNVTDSTMVADTEKVTDNFMCGLDKQMQNYSRSVYLADSTGKKIGNATDAQFGQYVCVEVSVDYVPMTPGLGFLKTMTIRSKSGMGSEAN